MIMAELIYLMEAITEQADTETKIWVPPLLTTGYSAYF